MSENYTVYGITISSSVVGYLIYKAVRGGAATIYENREQLIVAAEVVARRLWFFLVRRKWQFLIAAGLLMGIGKWPSDFYRILHFAVCVAALCMWNSRCRTRRLQLKGMLVQTSLRGERNWRFMLFTLALLFNPFVSLHFKRASWQVLDLLAAILFLILPLRQVDVVNIDDTQ